MLSCLFSNFFRIKFVYLFQIYYHRPMQYAFTKNGNPSARTSLSVLLNVSDSPLFSISLLSTSEMITVLNVKRASKHLQNFKKWIDAANSSERYCQQYIELFIFILSFSCYQF
uniref:Uncharacterized protein n=1 Tax=Onchocerca volvulus TaxID=6282 RepID=A0A8R1XRW7_ONCVO